MNDFSRYNARMFAALRGRPRTASEELRANNYRDETGRYVLVNGRKHWHERIVDYMVGQPNAKIVDIARFFDVTPGWVGMLVETDAFREYYAMRMRDHQEHIQHEVVNKMSGVAVKALDKMSEALDKPDATFSMAREAADLTLKGIGFGTKSPGINVAVNGNNATVAVQVESSMVEQARRRIQERMKANSASAKFDHSDYTHVTQDITPQSEEVEDAILINPDEDDG